MEYREILDEDVMKDYLKTVSTKTSGHLKQKICIRSTRSYLTFELVNEKQLRNELEVTQPYNYPTAAHQEIYFSPPVAYEKVRYSNF